MPQGVITPAKMKTPFKIFRNILQTGIILTVAVTLLSCEKKMEVIKKSDILSLPTLTVKHDTTIYTDSAKLQLIMYSPIIERYPNIKPPYAEFREGIKVWFYNGHTKSVGSFTSKYAKFMEDKRLWELKDSVVAVNERNEKLETELLYWDQDKELIYTDRAVKITYEDEIVLGIGMKSNPKFTNWWIRDVSATIPISEYE
jgi:LPS export ABC transporter protein LptC